MSNKQRVKPEKRPFGDYPYVLMMRTESETGSGGWIMVPMDTVATDEMVKAFAALLEPLPLNRASCIENTERAFANWARQEGVNKRELLRHG